MTQIVDSRYAAAKQRRTAEADQNLRSELVERHGKRRADELMVIAVPEPEIEVSPSGARRRARG